eukprot:765304-Hanusia_phi.AAC.1
MQSRDKTTCLAWRFPVLLPSYSLTDETGIGYLIHDDKVLLNLTSWRDSKEAFLKIQETFE